MCVSQLQLLELSCTQDIAFGLPQVFTSRCCLAGQRFYPTVTGHCSHSANDILVFPSTVYGLFQTHLNTADVIVLADDIQGEAHDEGAADEYEQLLKLDHRPRSFICLHIALLLHIHRTEEKSQVKSCSNALNMIPIL